MPTGTRDAPDEFTRALAKVIEEALRDRGLSQTQLSNLTSIPRPSITHLVNANRHFDMTELRKISVPLRVPVSELIRRAEERLE